MNNILDLVLTTTPENIVNLSCISPATMDISSDHHLLFFDILHNLKSTGYDKRTVFDFHLADWDTLHETLNHLDLSPDTTSDDINADWLQWKGLFLGAAAKHIPQKSFKRRSTPPWLDGEVKHLLNRKNWFRRNAKRRLCSKLWEKYRELRRVTKYVITNKRKQFFESMPALLKSSSKKFWSVFKSVRKTSSVPNKMTWSDHDGVTSTANNPADIANLLNRYFYSVFQPSHSNNDEHALSNSNDDSITKSDAISNITLTSEEVYYVLAALDENKATGPDKIPAKLLKICASSVCSSLCDIFNKSLSIGKLPCEWKLSNIIPIPKKGPADEVSNYRPISLLSLVSKVFERCVYNQLIHHVSSQLHHLQFGFLKGKSTTSQLLRVLHDINKSLENRSQVDSVYLDFAKAFDKVSHNLLLVKLQRFGIRGDLLLWFKDYLSGRYQRVTVLGESSHTLPVLSGVPQGSILGPLLFLVFVNDLPDSISTQSSVAMFADDTKCYRPVNKLADCKNLQNDLNKLVTWCNDWRMDLNQSKCGVLSITRSRQPIIAEYQLIDTSLKSLTTQKDLGIIISNDLKWNKQVYGTVLKANMMLGFIRRSASDINNIQVRKILYLSLVRSKLGYASQVWAPQTVTNIATMERVQRRATNFILSLPYRSDVLYKDRLQSIGILPICYWLEFLDLVYLYNCVVNDSDTNISIRVSNRRTRNSNSDNGILLNVPKSKTVSFQNSFYIRAPSVWNILSDILRDTTRSTASFKSLLFRYYFNLLEHIYNPDNPRTFKSVCVKCHSTRSIQNLSFRSCC